MADYRYSLELGNRKHICPGCGKRRFVRFIDSNTGEYLPAEYGRCDREINCGYFQKPDDKIRQPYSERRQYFNTDNKSRQRTVTKLAAYIPYEVLKQSRKEYAGNSFIKYLLHVFGQSITENLIKTYHLGSSNSRWPGATVFWFIDISGNVRAGQVKLFDETGHTKKYEAEGGKKSCTTWLHSILKYNYEIRQKELPAWLTTYLNQGGNYASCLYGEHILKQECTKPVAIVEAPATAIVASVYLPAFIWLAAGSLSYLTTDRVQVLSGRQVYLFPDLSTNRRAFELWKGKAKELAGIASITVSDLLERYATVEEMWKGLDLRDFLTRYDYKQFNFQPSSTKDDPIKYLLTVDSMQFEIKGIVSVSELGSQFDNYKIACFHLTKHHFCDVLFDGNGELVNDREGFSQVIYARIGKAFRPGKLNGVDCLLMLTDKTLHST